MQINKTSKYKYINISLSNSKVCLFKGVSAWVTPGKRRQICTSPSKQFFFPDGCYANRSNPLLRVDCPFRWTTIFSTCPSLGSIHLLNLSHSEVCSEKAQFTVQSGFVLFLFSPELNNTLSRVGDKADNLQYVANTWTKIIFYFKICENLKFFQWRRKTDNRRSWQTILRTGGSVTTFEDVRNFCMLICQ